MITEKDAELIKVQLLGKLMIVLHAKEKSKNPQT